MCDSIKSSEAQIADRNVNNNGQIHKVSVRTEDSLGSGLDAMHVTLWPKSLHFTFMLTLCVRLNVKLVGYDLLKSTCV